MPDANRIEQLKRSVEQNPNDELGQFALGSALFDDKKYQDAGPCFQRVLAINSQNSKAYELLASVQKQTGHPELAVQTATNGYRVAQRRGDVMPMKAMESLLKELGAPVPIVAEKPAEQTATSGGTATCRRCGTVGSQLPRPPFKGVLGQTIFETVCQNCWREWVGQGTKVINELRLPMHDLQAQATYDKHMKEFLLID